MAPRWRNLGALFTCLAASWLAFELPRIPVLSLVDLGFASVGHAAGEVVAAVVPAPTLPALAGLLAPVAVPLALAGRFLRSRAERTAGALCLAWAATVLTGLAVAFRDAVAAGPAHPGPASDWVVLLGRTLDRSALLTDLLGGGAVLLLLAAVALCAVPLLTDVARGHPPRPAAGATAWSGPNRRRI